MTSKPFIISESPFIFQVFPNEEKDKQEIYILIHGWSGNENSMTVFLNSLPDSSLAILPRGNIAINNMQFGWVDIRSMMNNDFQHYQNVAILLHDSIINILQNLSFDQSQKINLMGFSQGAALSFVYSQVFENQVNKVALLSGFIPNNSPPWTNKVLNPIKYYVSHGTYDELVDYEKAVQLRKYLENEGAEVHFCSAEVGHKVSAECLAGLKSFFI